MDNTHENGSLAANTAYCSQCGHLLNPGDKFCHACGYRLETKNEYAGFCLKREKKGRQSMETRTKMTRHGALTMFNKNKQMFALFNSTNNCLRKRIAYMTTSETWGAESEREEV